MTSRFFRVIAGSVALCALGFVGLRLGAAFATAQHAHALTDAHGHVFTFALTRAHPGVVVPLRDDSFTTAIDLFDLDGDGRIQSISGQILGQTTYPPEFWVDHALIDLEGSSTIQRLLEQAIYPPNQWKRHWHPIVGICSTVPPSQWQEIWWKGIFSKIPGATLQVFNAGQSDMVVHQDSQSNGRLFAATVFGDTIHAAIPGIQNVLAETASSPIALRVRELLSSYNSSHWQGDLGQ